MCTTSVTSLETGKTDYYYYALQKGNQGSKGGNDLSMHDEVGYQPRSLQPIREALGR